MGSEEIFSSLQSAMSIPPDLFSWLEFEASEGLAWTPTYDEEAETSASEEIMIQEPPGPDCPDYSWSPVRDEICGHPTLASNCEETIGKSQTRSQGHEVRFFSLGIVEASEDPLLTFIVTDEKSQESTLESPTSSLGDPEPSQCGSGPEPSQCGSGPEPSQCGSGPNPPSPLQHALSSDIQPQLDSSGSDRPSGFTYFQTRVALQAKAKHPDVFARLMRRGLIHSLCLKVWDKMNAKVKER